MKQKLKCILLVDDDPATHFLHNRVISRLACSETFATADTGLEALAFLKHMWDTEHTTPELILLDINMPLMNAWEFLGIYGRLPAEQKIKTTIVMVTTSHNPDDEMRARNIRDIKAFKLKPLDKEMMQQILETHFANFL